MCLKKMFNTGKMMADPMNRFMTFGQSAAQALEVAKGLNPENPRVYLLEGIDKYYTPEQYGGSKTEGKRLFEEAMKKFEAIMELESVSKIELGFPHDFLNSKNVKDIVSSDMYGKIIQRN